MRHTRFMNTLEGRMDASGQHVVVVVSRWNELITKELVEGALETLRQCGDPEVSLIKVPGTWEIPVAVQSALEHLRPNAVVALGCILQGQTTHAQLLAGDVSGALMNLQVAHGVPIAWGILTPDTAEQGLDRAGLKHGNKGREAATAAVEMLSLLNQLADSASE